MSTAPTTAVRTIYLPLRLTYSLVPIIAGADKFAGLLTNWEKYLPASIAGQLPVDVDTFMRVVGLIEIAAGLAVLTYLPRLGAYVVMLWLVLVACVAATAGFLDIAVRDLVMAVGAYSLGQVAKLCDRRWVAAATSTEGSQIHAPAT